MRKCYKCGWSPEDEILDSHHIVPKVLGGTDADGRRALCGESKGNDCHRKYHTWLREQQDVKDLLKKKFQEWIDE